jgi:hypothetical protein
MRLWAKRIALGLGALLASGALLIGGWFASNWVDADPAPWPAELTVAPSPPTPPNPLYAALLSANLGSDSLSTQIGDCAEGNCLAAWRAQSAKLLPAWAAQRAQQAAFGAACEAWAAQRPLPYREPVPTAWTMDKAIPSVQVFVRCAHWLLGSALAASEAGQDDAALAHLALAQGSDQALLEGSQSLIGHMIAVSLMEQRLQVTLWVADKHPALAARLQQLTGPRAEQVAAAQARWIAHEASYNRGVMNDLNQVDNCAKADAAMRGHAEPLWLCKLGQFVLMPTYTEQLFARHWLAIRSQIDPTRPFAVVDYAAGAAAAPATGLLGSDWHWRGTVPHILFDVARPAYWDYFRRGADAVLANATSGLWLEARATAVPAARHTAWLSERLKAHPLGSSLTPRLTVQADGSWLLQRATKARDNQLTRWPQPA